MLAQARILSVSNERSPFLHSALLYLDIFEWLGVWKESGHSPAQANHGVQPAEREARQIGQVDPRLFEENGTNMTSEE